MPDSSSDTGHGLPNKNPLRPDTTAGAHQRKLVFGFDPLRDRIDV
jgi:hypothetical protein